MKGDIRKRKQYQQEVEKFVRLAQEYKNTQSLVIEKMTEMAQIYYNADEELRGIIRKSVSYTSRLWAVLLDIGSGQLCPKMLTWDVAEKIKNTVAILSCIEQELIIDGKKVELWAERSKRIRTEPIDNLTADEVDIVIDVEQKAIRTIEEQKKYIEEKQNAAIISRATVVGPSYFIDKSGKEPVIVVHGKGPHIYEKRMIEEWLRKLGQ